MYQYSILLVILFLVACNSSSEEKKRFDKMQKELTAKYKPINRCYQYINSKDTILLQTQYVGIEVSGKLSYKYNQRNDTIGAIKGIVTNDTIIVDYQYKTDTGLINIDKVFLIKNNTAIEAKGKMVQDFNDKHHKTFQSTADLKLDEKIILEAIDCP